MRQVAIVGVALSVAACGPDRPSPDSAVYVEPTSSVPPEELGTVVPFVMDAQRILVKVAFARPDGTPREALAWFNMGMAAPVLSDALFRDLQVDAHGGRPVILHFGTVDLAVKPATFVDGDSTINGDREFEHYFSPYPVEAVLPGGLFERCAVTIDYEKHTLSVTAPAAAARDGIPVPVRLNAATGFAVVDVRIDGRTYPFVLDAGSGYTWVRGSAMRDWSAAHPEWRRATGAVGQANNAMVDYDFEKKGTVARIPALEIGSLLLTDVGVFGTGPLLGAWGDAVFGELFWSSWQKSAPVPITGWLGGNVLKQFKLTIDYPDRMTYWQRQQPPDSRDLDSVPITLVRRQGRYFVGGIVERREASATDAPATGISVGDELISVDGVKAPGATKEAILSALHGSPGDVRRLILQRNGSRIAVSAAVSSFE